MRAWIVAAGMLLAGAAQALALETLHQQDDWVVAFEAGETEASDPFCILARIVDSWRGETLSLAIHAGGRGTVTFTRRSWAETPPEGPLDLRIDGARWTLDWAQDGTYLHATVASAGVAGRLSRALAGAAEASLTDRAGEPLLRAPLEGGEDAFAALDRCVGTRLGREPG